MKIPPNGMRKPGGRVGNLRPDHVAPRDIFAKPRLLHAPPGSVADAPGGTADTPLQILREEFDVLLDRPDGFQLALVPLVLDLLVPVQVKLPVRPDEAITDIPARAIVAGGNPEEIVPHAGKQLLQQTVCPRSYSHAHSSRLASKSRNDRTLPSKSSFWLYSAKPRASWIRRSSPPPRLLGAAWAGSDLQSTQLVLPSKTLISTRVSPSIHPKTLTW